MCPIQLVGAGIIILIIVLLLFKRNEHNESVSRHRLVMSSIARSVDEKLNFQEFKKMVDHPKFNINAYDMLRHYYKKGELTEDKLIETMKKYPTKFWNE